MSSSEIPEILQKAILLERQGQRFYESIAEKTENSAVRRIFLAMAAEEKGHENTLLTQYRKYTADGELSPGQVLEVPDEFSEKVLSAQVKEEIHSASYEAAAISAAMGLEQNTVDLYTSREKKALDDVERKLFHDLASWEETHLKFLNNLNREILQNAFFDGVE